ncbi:hypothetical protein GJAV_G00127590 [Gymnothorax javanicus]|nr:hypothetical protein GJAV_G00127590 [Gymnothorax javanicus]
MWFCGWGKSLKTETSHCAENSARSQRTSSGGKGTVRLPLVPHFRNTYAGWRSVKKKIMNFGAAIDRQKLVFGPADPALDTFGCKFRG